MVLACFPRAITCDFAWLFERRGSVSWAAALWQGVCEDIVMIVSVHAVGMSTQAVNDATVATAWHTWAVVTVVSFLSERSLDCV